MPFCPNCRYEYRRGIETCSDCGAQLVDELPDEPYSPPPPSGNDVPIARAESLAIAEMWAELLGDEDIACRIQPAGMGDNVLVPGSQTFWEVRVAAIDARRARELLPSEAHQTVPMEVDADAADSAAMSQALRWFIVAGVVFIALMILVVGARSLT